MKTPAKPERAPAVRAAPLPITKADAPPRARIGSDAAAAGGGGIAAVIAAGPFACAPPWCAEFLCTRSTPQARRRKESQSVGPKRRPMIATEKTAAHSVLLCASTCATMAERLSMAMKTWGTHARCSGLSGALGTECTGSREHRAWLRRATRLFCTM